MYIYNKVYSFLFVFLGLSHISAMAQNAVIERQYKTTYYSNALSCYKDTTCSIFFTIKDGRVVDASICVAAYDRVHVQAANISFNNNNISDVSFHSIFDNVSYPVSTSSSGSSGCSSCGGGCSSCGGGCSSCGGGGSW